VPQPTWRLRWADEFSGSELDARKWEAQLGNGSYYGIPGWGNAERQTYTDRQVNVRVQGGHLVIQAQREAADSDAAKAAPGAAAAAAAAAPYTSARIRTCGKFAVRPTAATPTVRIESRIRVPQGLGLWSAFWALPEDPNHYDTCSGCGTYGGWPASGELDIMEAANRMHMVSQHPACWAWHACGFEMSAGVWRFDKLGRCVVLSWVAAARGGLPFRGAFEAGRPARRPPAATTAASHR
jgi:beta-glucanase (GH16 family)